MEEMVKQGIISQKRYESLCNNKWNHDLILHEAGVPPIHTPMKVLNELPENVSPFFFPLFTKYIKFKIYLPIVFS